MFSYKKTIMAVCIGSVTPLYSATAADAVLEEIVVTARKRGAESLQGIPATISAFSESQLDAMGVTDFTDFAYHVPGLTFNDQSPGEKRYVIRGVQSAGQQQVAVYYDEVPLPGVQSSTSDSGSQTPDLKMHDMNRVEVLKGPQGTVFGANSQTGTVRFITNKADLEGFSASTGGTYSQTDPSEDSNHDVNVMLNVPIIEHQLALRVVAYDSSDAGFVDNVRLNQADINWIDTQGIRTQLRWAPNEKLTLDGMFWYEDRDTGGDGRYHPFDTYQQNPGSENQGHLDNVSPSSFFQTGTFQVGDYSKTPKPDEQTILSLTANWDLDWAHMTATASHYERDFGFKFDSTWIVLFLGAEGERDDLWPAQTDQDQSLEQDALEIRFNSTGAGPWHWVGGVFYRKRESEFQSFVPVVNDNGEPFDPGTAYTGPSDDPGAGIPGCHPCVFARVADKDIEEQAVFAEITYEFAENWEVTAGLRWFDVEQSDFGATVFQFALFSDQIPPPNQAEMSQDEVIQKYLIAYTPNDDMNLYALASQGFRLGGTNNQGIAEVPRFFESDELWNYELGMKSTWLDGRLRLNAALYHVVWENLQVGGEDPTGAFGFIGNAGEAEVDGIELELFTVPTDSLELSFGLSYLFKNELTEDQVSDEVVAPGLKGDILPRVPELTYNISAQYNFDYAVGDWDGWLRSDFIYKDAAETQLSPDSPNNRSQDSYELWSLRLGASSDEYGLDLTLFWDNVLDEEGDVYLGVGNGEPTNKFTNRPSTVGLTFTKYF